MSSKKKLLEHLETEVFCRLGVSTKQGVGVFAIRAIPQGVDPVKPLVHRRDKIISLTDADLDSVSAPVKQLMNDFFGNDARKGKRQHDAWYNGPNDMNISFYFNHSKTPNVEIVESHEGSYLGFPTKRSIRAGEELFIDYDQY